MRKASIALHKCNTLFYFFKIFFLQSAAITYINEVTNIIRKELAKVKRLPKAKRAGGLESLRKRYLNLVEENLNSSKAFNNTRDATIIVDKTIVINNGNDTLNSTTLSVKVSLFFWH